MATLINFNPYQGLVIVITFCLLLMSSNCQKRCIENVCVWDLYREPELFNDLVTGGKNQSTIRIHYSVSSNTQDVTITAYEYQAAALTMALLDFQSMYKDTENGLDFESVAFYYWSAIEQK